MPVPFYPLALCVCPALGTHHIYKAADCLSIGRIAHTHTFHGACRLRAAKASNRAALPWVGASYSFSHYLPALALASSLTLRWRAVNAAGHIARGTHATAFMGGPWRCTWPLVSLWAAFDTKHLHAAQACPEAAAAALPAPQAAKADA